MEITIDKLKNKKQIYITVLLPNDKKVQLNQYTEDGIRQLTYAERLREVMDKIVLLQNYPIASDRGEFYIRPCQFDELSNVFEKYWMGRKNDNGGWSEKVKLCLDYIATYLLLAPDSGINPLA